MLSKETHMLAGETKGGTAKHQLKLMCCKCNMKLLLDG